jgi:hypothetical protein
LADDRFGDEGMTGRGGVAAGFAAGLGSYRGSRYWLARSREVRFREAETRFALARICS